LLSPVVTIDVMPADVPAEYAPAMVDACTQALPEGSCALASATPESTQPEAVALVLWQGDRLLQVTVRVGRHGTQWVARHLEFSERDTLADRFTTVGLTVATLVGEGKAAENGNAAPPVEPAPALPLVPPPAAPRAEPVPRFELSFDLAAMLGTAFQGGATQAGAWGAGRLQFKGSPFVAQASAAYAVSDGPELAGYGSLHSRWLSAGLGLGASGVIRPVDLRATALVELLLRRVSSSLQGAQASDTELPVQLRVLAAWPARGPLALMLGSALRIPLGGSETNDVGHVRQPLFGADVLAGLEVRL